MWDHHWDDHLRKVQFNVFLLILLILLLFDYHTMIWRERDKENRLVIFYFYSVSFLKYRDNVKHHVWRRHRFVENDFMEFIGMYSHVTCNVFFFSLILYFGLIFMGSGWEDDLKISLKIFVILLVVKQKEKTLKTIK